VYEVTQPARDRGCDVATKSCHPIRIAYFGVGIPAALHRSMDSARVISRAWTVHCLVIGVLAVTCIAVCIAHWPLHGASGFEASGVMLAMSGGLVVYALATSILLQLARARCGAVLAIHVLGIITLAVVVAVT
jgi:hypothetical protein